MYIRFCPCCAREVTAAEGITLAEYGMCARCKEELERRVNWHDRVIDYVIDVLEKGAEKGEQG